MLCSGTGSDHCACEPKHVYTKLNQSDYRISATEREIFSFN